VSFTHSDFSTCSKEQVDAQQYKTIALTSSKVQGTTLRAAAAATSLPTSGAPVKLSCNRQQVPLQCSSLYIQLFRVTLATWHIECDRCIYGGCSTMLELHSSFHVPIP
jgi:hypothetical protein